jgi:hypothetical protein
MCLLIVYLLTLFNDALNDVALIFNLFSGKSFGKMKTSSVGKKWGQ